MKYFIEAMLDGFACIGLVAGGAIGGMSIISGHYQQDYFMIFCGATTIIINMVVSLIIYWDNKEK